jgi:hypothetical protein
MATGLVGEFEGHCLPVASVCAPRTADVLKAPQGLKLTALIFIKPDCRLSNDSMIFITFSDMPMNSNLAY